MSTNHGASGTLPFDDGQAAWPLAEQSLDARGYAIIPGLLTAQECQALVAMYPQQELFRSRIVMARHHFGSGEYQYFRYPLPANVALLRASLYSRLYLLANRWNRMLSLRAEYPPQLAAFLTQCADAGQSRPTPLLLKYGAGDYNCLHQDVYGDHVFPLQVAILLSRPGVDFDGGEFVMTENRHGQQKACVVALRQGDAVIFTVRNRPVAARRLSGKVEMRHGVSRITRGSRYTLGLIFHDAT